MADRFFESVSEGLSCLPTHPLRGWKGKVVATTLAGGLAASIYGIMEMQKEGQGDLAMMLGMTAVVLGLALLTMIIKEIADGRHHANDHAEAYRCEDNCEGMYHNADNSIRY